MSDKPPIGFVGIGAMGYGMACNLLRSGYPLCTVAHRRRGRIEKLLRHGANECDSYRKLAEQSEIIMLCLSDSKAVSSVIEQLMPGLRPGHTVVDTGTSLPRASEKLHQRLSASGIDFAESPVAGGAAQALSGELGAMVGASPEVFAAIEPVIGIFCSNVEHFGPVGRASRAKLISNHLVLNMAALVYETFSSAALNGSDWEKLYRPMLCGSGNSVVLQRIIGNAIKGDFAGYIFSVDNARKDLEYIAQLNQEMEGAAGMTDAALRLFRKATKLGFGDRMISELLEPDVRRALMESEES